MCGGCLMVSGGAAVLPKSQHTSAGRGSAGYGGRHDGAEVQQGGLAPL